MNAWNEQNDDGPGEHDAHLLDDVDDSVDTVPCPSCGRHILAEAAHCPKCGVPFRGQAWQAQTPSDRRVWQVVAVVVFLLVVAIAVAGLCL